MTQQPLERVSLIDSLVDRLEAQIVAKDYPVGSRLPGEEELAVQFGVSRPVVREGLSRLRERGYLETVNGRGTFIRHPGAEHLADSLLRQIRVGNTEDYSVDNLYEARGAIELTTTRLAALRADAGDIARLRVHLEDMVRYSDDPSRYTTADVGFHVDVAKAARNPFLSALLQPLAKIIIEGILESSQTRPEAVDDGIRMHTEVLRCIEARDSDGAARAMELHLHDSRRAFPGELLDRLG
ncbi:MAG: FadR/GntR family transcriptional regulator [Propionibacteriaceae bacterium]